MFVNISKHEVTIKGRIVDLTPREWQLLTMLVEKPGHLVPTERIYREFYGEAWEEIDSRGLTQHLARLRRKIGPDRIKTEPCFGLKFVGRVRVR